MINPSPPRRNRPLCYFTLSNARRFLLVKGEPLGVKGLKLSFSFYLLFLVELQEALRVAGKIRPLIFTVLTDETPNMNSVEEVEVL